MIKPTCPICNSLLKVEHYFYKNILYRSRLVCSNKGLIYCSYVKEFPLPVVFWSEDLKYRLVNEKKL